MDLATTYQLTPADVMDLRAWRAANKFSCAFNLTGLDVPYIVCSPSDGSLYLNMSTGRTVAGNMRAEVLCALLIAERLEPGYCERLCDASLTPQEALRDPLARLQARARIEEARAREKAALADAASERTRRGSHLDLHKLDLSDLTKTL